MARTIAIGDVHGCAKALGSLLDAINPRSDDTLVMLGDCIDRGAESKQAVKLLLDWRKKCRIVPILGNHEEMLLSALSRPFMLDDWLACGGAPTLASYGVSDPALLPREHLDYLQTWRDYFEISGYFFAHANYEADIPLENQIWDFWRWEPLRSTLPGPHVSGKKAIVGHTSQKTGHILELDHLICIDTYCHGGGWLTAMEVHSGQVWQANSAGQLRESDAR